MGSADPAAQPTPQTGTRLAAADAEALARDRYGLDARVRELCSYADQNFRLDDASGRRFVLKVARAEEDPRALVFELDVLARLQPLGLPVPRVLPDRDGRRLVRTADAGGTDRLVRLLSWLEGTPLAELDAPSPALRADLGRTLARLDAALLEIPAPGVRAEHRWDLMHAATAIRRHLHHHVDAARRGRVERTLTHLESSVLPRLARLRRGIVHNDANDHNVLVHADHPDRVAGLIDFGDMVHTPLVCEPAIAMCYTMLTADDPLAPAAALLAGYHAVLPLRAEELDLLPDLVEARLCVSVTLSTYERTRRPDDPYLSVTEPHAWRLLEWFASGGQKRLAEALRDACPGAEAP